MLTCGLRVCSLRQCARAWPHVAPGRPRRRGERPHRRLRPSAESRRDTDSLSQHRLTERQDGLSRRDERQAASTDS
eukprot:5621550-Prymnesium_polylepis.1